MELKRGDIFFIRSYDNNQGSEQTSDRPAVVVSNNKCNTYSNVIEIVYLTTKPKKPMPTHVAVVCQRLSTALCEQVCSISIDRLGMYIKTATDAEMKEIDKALLVSLALDVEEPADEDNHEKQAMLAHIEYLEKQVSELNYNNRFLTDENGRLKDEAAAKVDCDALPAELKFAQLESERNTYKAMYEQLLNKILEK